MGLLATSRRDSHTDGRCSSKRCLHTVSPDRIKPLSRRHHFVCWIHFPSESLNLTCCEHLHAMFVAGSEAGISPAPLSWVAWLQQRIEQAASHSGHSPGVCTSASAVRPHGCQSLCRWPGPAAGAARALSLFWSAAGTGQGGTTLTLACSHLQPWPQSSTQYFLGPPGLQSGATRPVRASALALTGLPLPAACTAPARNS